jgi:single-stranded DNA-binding protein
MITVNEVVLVGEVSSVAFSETRSGAEAFSMIITIFDSSGIVPVRINAFSKLVKCCSEIRTGDRVAVVGEIMTRRVVNRKKNFEFYSIEIRARVVSIVKHLEDNNGQQQEGGVEEKTLVQCAETNGLVTADTVNSES